MIIYIVVYFISFAITLFVCKINRLKVKPFPPITVKKDGLTFYSKSNHKLKMHGAKVLQLGNNVFLKKCNKMVCVENVDNVFVHKEHLYFKCLGNCKIKMNLTFVYKYFSLDIESENVDMQNLKNLAINNIKNHIFDLKNAIFLKKYIKIIKNIFKIKIEDKKIFIQQNKFKMPFVVKYFSDGKKKKVKVN